MSRRGFLRGSAALAGAGLLAGCDRLPFTSAPPTVHRIGYLGAALGEQALRAFQDGLRELGYIEGKHYTWEPRDTQGRSEQMPELAAELAAARPSLAVAPNPLAIRALRDADGNLPIVMVGASEVPVGLGLVESLARPGGSVTGLALGHPELATKRLQLLGEIVPGLARVAVLGDANFGPWESNPKYPLFREAAGQLGLELRVVHVQTPDEFAGALKAMAEAGVGGFYADPSPLVYTFRAQLAELAIQRRLPGIYGSSLYADAGPLVYGANVLDIWRRAPVIVDKILRGTKPADIPVEVPTTFDFVVNLKLARALGLAIPDSVLSQATEIIR